MLKILKVGQYSEGYPKETKTTSYRTEEESALRKHFISYGRKNKCVGSLVQDT